MGQEEIQLEHAVNSIVSLLRLCLNLPFLTGLHQVQLSILLLICYFFEVFAYGIDYIHLESLAEHLILRVRVLLCLWHSTGVPSGSTSTATRNGSRIRSLPH